MDKQEAIRNIRQGILKQKSLEWGRIVEVLDKIIGFYPEGWEGFGEGIIWQGFYFDTTYGAGSSVGLKTYVKQRGKDTWALIGDASDLLNILETYEPVLPGGKINDYSYP